MASVLGADAAHVLEFQWWVGLTDRGFLSPPPQGDVKKKQKKREREGERERERERERGGDARGSLTKAVPLPNAPL